MSPNPCMPVTWVNEQSSFRIVLLVSSDLSLSPVSRWQPTPMWRRGAPKSLPFFSGAFSAMVASAASAAVTAEYSP
eukprot:8673136-Pyramimonas_sp.AAC.1